MKRVLIFAVAHHPFIGGAEIAVHELTKRINPKKISFDMITIRYDKMLPAVERIGHITVHRIGMGSLHPALKDLNSPRHRLNKYLYPFLAWRYASQMHRRTPYDAIWSMMASYSGYAASFFKARHPNVPFLLTLQEGDSPEHIRRRAGVTYGLYKKIFTRADVVQSISAYLGEYAARQGFQKKSIIIPNGVDVSLFSQTLDSDERFALRHELGAGPDDMVLISTSRLVHKNAIDDCIRALAKLPRTVRLVLVGDGHDRGKLESLARNSGVSERVTFVGYREYADLPRYLAASDIFIRPSRSEGMGNSFIEAMAAGIPIIGTPVGGIVDFLKSPENDPNPTGLLVNVGDSEGISAAVRRLIEDVSLREVIVGNARRLVIERYTWDSSAQAMESLFESLTTKTHEA